MIKKIITLLLFFSFLTGCVGMDKKDNPTKLEKSPCACGDIYEGKSIYG